jgi:PAS domain S-box-containing protein
MDAMRRQSRCPERLEAKRVRDADTTDAVVLVERDGTIGSWSRQAEAMFGQTPEDVVGLPFWSLFAPECGDLIDGLTLTAPSEPVRGIATAFDRHGDRFEVEITSTRTLAARDGVTGIVCVLCDVTTRNAVDRALMACSEGRDSLGALVALRAVLSPWLPDAEVTIGLMQNDRYRRPHADPALMNMLVGQDTRQRGSPLRAAADGKAVVVQDTRARVFAVDAGLAARGVRSYVLIPLVCDGRVYGTLNAGFSKPWVANRRIVRLLAAVADAIGPVLLRALEFEEQARAILRLERLGRREKEFLALIAHDMRTPLAVIAGFASSLLEKWDDLPDGERLEGLDAILRNGRSLTRLVEQDLQLALIDGGQLSYELSTFDLAAQVQRITSELARTTDARFVVRSEPSQLVHADPERNWQILANLLSNAVKFTAAQTPIEIGIRRDGPMVRVAVRDRGRGISRVDARRLFRKFSRVGSPDGPALRGTGLGLYLSRRMVEAQGGRIWVKSEPGEGSTFTYTLPAAERQPRRDDAIKVGLP